jgi:spore coat polysaccharide biosynthesis protein SpsF
MNSQRKVGIISQARTTSTRLPRKVLLEAGGKTVLEHGIDRLKWAGYPIYVATTTNQTDDVIVSLCEKLNIPYYRGSEHDVLSRYYECAKKFELDVIVRVTSDNPLIDGYLVKDGIERYLALPENSYVSNCLERTFPHGFNFEIFSFGALENAYKNAKEGFEREHVTPFILNPEKNIGVNFSSLRFYKDATHYRMTLDEEDDWKLLQKLLDNYRAFEKKHDEIIKILDENPALTMINSHIEQKKI